MTKFMKILVLTTVLSFGLFGVARAFLTDTEQSYANPVQASTINLQVGDSDPSAYSFSFPNVVPGQISETETLISGNGGVEGNFWLEIAGSNSQEGENPEGETDTTGEGDLMACADVKLSFFDTMDVSNEIVLFDFMPLSTTLIEYELMDWGSTIDGLVNAGRAKMKLQLQASRCGNEIMGDTFDIDIVFHLEQQA